MSYPDGIDAECDNRSAQVIQIDSGKHVAVVALCAALCGISVAVTAYLSYSFHLSTESYRKDLQDVGTEYRVVLNHTMELEAQQKVLANELQEVSHVRR